MCRRVVRKNEMFLPHHGADDGVEEEEEEEKDASAPF